MNELNLVLRQQQMMWEAAEVLHSKTLQNGALILHKIRKLLSDEERDEVEGLWQDLMESVRRAEVKLKPPIIGFGLELLLKEWVTRQNGRAKLEYQSTIQVDQKKLGVFYHIFQNIIEVLPTDFCMKISVSETSMAHTKIYFKLKGGVFVSESLDQLKIWTEVIRDIGVFNCDANSVTLII